MSDTQKIALTEEKETLLITLFAKAGDSALPDSELRDTHAAEAVRKIDYDFSKLKVDRNMMIGVASRAMAFDRWTRDFIAAHANAVVLHLGCGLDTRVFRVNPPATVAWFDVDYPEVIALRRKLYPEREGYALIGSSVTETAWLEGVPRDRAMMVVVEGLTMYLEEEEVQRLFTAITDHAPSGEIAMDVFSKLGVKLIQRQRSVRATGAKLKWGTDDARAFETLVPKMRFVEEVAAYDGSRMDRFSFASRLAIRVMLAIPALRRLGRYLRYRF